MYLAKVNVNFRLQLYVDQSPTCLSSYRSLFSYYLPVTVEGGLGGGLRQHWDNNCKKMCLNVSGHTSSSKSYVGLTPTCFINI